jgi:Flp pilus assembly protein TadG
MCPQKTAPDRVRMSDDPRRGPGRKPGTSAGSALLEFTATLPILFLLIVFTINYGGWLYAWAQVGNAGRAIANYAVLGPVSAGVPPTPNAAAITALVTTDLAKLPNYSSTNPTVVVCWNNNGTITSITGTCGTGSSAPAADPEAGSYIAVSVDLTYTYTPIIQTFSIPEFHIGLPAMPTAIHRRIVMRFL